MSRSVPCKSSTVLAWIKDFPELHFDQIQLFCTACEKTISQKRKSDVMKHVSSEYHKRRVVGGTSDGGHSNSTNQQLFNLDLVEMLIGSSIPWKKLESPIFRQFLQNCVSGCYDIETKVPTGACLSQKYLPETCEDIKRKIIAELSDKHVWISLQETNACGRKVNLVIGGLHDENHTARGYLIASKLLDPNPQTITNLVLETLKLLWGENYPRNLDKFLLLITDSTPYMKSAAKNLKQSHQNLVHLTCLAHTLHQIAETIKECYANVDLLITNVNKVFKSDRIQVFQETFPNLPLPPPEPNPTNLGTWLEAASYFYCNFDAIKLVLQPLDPNETTLITQMFNDVVTMENLAFIHGNFSRISIAIRDVNKAKTVIDAMNVVFDLRSYLYPLLGGVAETVKAKMEKVLKNNSGFSIMTNIVKLLNDEKLDFSTVENINEAALKKFSYFKYAPVTMVDVEGAFSENKGLFSDKCRSLSLDQLEQVLIINYYSNHLS